MADLGEVRARLDRALADQPEDRATWRVYADLLLDDPDPAERALGEALALALDPDPAALDALAALRRIHRAAWTGATALPDAALDWWGGFVRGVRTAWTDEAVDAVPGLAASRAGRFLSSLDLSGSGDPLRGRRIVGDGVARLFAFPGMARITALDLSGMLLHRSGASALASARGARSLRTLALDGCRIGVAGARALTQSRRLRSLRRASLRDNRLTGDGAVALARHLDELEALALARDEITAADVRVLGDALPPTLRELDLGQNPLGPEGALAIASSRGYSGLEVLGLDQAGITDAGVAAIALSPHLAGLTALSLTGNVLGHGAIDALAAPGALPRLARLRLPGFGVDRERASALAPRVEVVFA